MKIYNNVAQPEFKPYEINIGIESAEEAEAIRYLAGYEYTVPDTICANLLPAERGTYYEHIRKFLEGIYGCINARM